MSVKSFLSSNISIGYRPVSGFDMLDDGVGFPVSQNHGYPEAPKVSVEDPCALLSPDSSCPRAPSRPVCVVPVSLRPPVRATRVPRPCGFGTLTPVTPVVVVPALGRPLVVGLSLLLLSFLLPPFRDRRKTLRQCPSAEGE